MEKTTPPEDLGDAIAYCETQLKRLNLHKKSPAIILYLHMAGFAGDWGRLNSKNDFRDLYKFLAQCEP